jgi:pimeloyl-ACP methyl ester carboxylesterase
MNQYQQPMPPWLALEEYARTLRLPDGEQVYLYDSRSADKPALLLLHGLGDDADTWRYVFHTLTKQHCVIAPDLPGFARSDPLNSGYQVDAYIQAVQAMLKELQRERVTLVGHSLGGLLAHRFALDYPQQVDRLVLIASSLLSSASSVNLQVLLYLIPGIGEWLYNRLRKDPKKAYETLRVYYYDLDGLSQNEREFSYQRVNQRVWSDRQRRTYLGLLRSLARWAPQQQRDLEGRLAEMKIPTTLIWGEADAIIPMDNGKRTAALQPNARFISIAKAGHNLQHENPLALLENILQENTPDRDLTTA